MNRVTGMPEATTTTTTMSCEQETDDVIRNRRWQRQRNCCRWLNRAIQFCNTFSVTILGCCVVWIFLQLQYISFSLQEESNRIDELLKEIEQKQTQQIEALDQKVEDNHTLTLFQMAGTFTLLTCLVTMYHMYTHLRNYNEPIVQRRIVTILWMSPIYSVTAFLSLLFPVAEGYLGIIRDFYEAYCVYTFLALLVAILGRGDRDVVVNVLAQRAEHLKKPTVCLRSCYHPPPDTSDEAMASAVLYECQVLAMQFVFCRPLTSIASFVCTTLMENRRDEDDGEFFKTPNFYIAMVTNLSVFLAFTGLLKFYHAVHQDLLWCQPFSKFMALKGIVFITFWQGLIIAIFVSVRQSEHTKDAGSSSEDAKSAEETAGAIQNILICLEMLIFSIAHMCVFPADEWEPDYRPRGMHAPTLGIKDFAKDVKYIMSSGKRRRDAAKAESTDLSLTLSYSMEDDEALDSPETERPDESDHRIGLSSNGSYQHISSLVV